MRKALHIHPVVRDQRATSSTSIKRRKQRPRPKLALIHGTPKEPSPPSVLTEREVEVFDRDGQLIAAFSIVLEDENALDAEFEEVALIFAEQSGRVNRDEFLHLRARCV